jgi:uncharacterized membrane protein
MCSIACMSSWRHKVSRGGLVTVALVGVAYPELVYAGRASLPPLAFVAAALGIVCLRAAVSHDAARPWRYPLAVAAVAIATIAIVDQSLAARAYPCVLSLAAASVFGLSLVCPPSLIERFARLREPDLPAEGQAYCRTVTKVWTAWLLANAAIAGWLGAVGNDEAWALWTGLISYLVSGCLFGGEFAVRRIVRGKAVT